MAKVILPRMTAEGDFYKQTSTVAKYNVGSKICVADDSTAIPTVYRYIKAHAALTANQPYIVVEGADVVTTAAPATSTVTKIVGIPQVDIAKDAFGWVAIEGICKAKTGIQAKGDTLEVLNAGTTLVVDGTSGTPAETAGTVAISCEAASAAATVKVNLIHKRVTVAAS